MQDRDQQLIWEAYINENQGLEPDPLTWTEGDIVVLQIANYNIRFIYRRHQQDRKGNHYVSMQPAEDYSKYGMLPNIGTQGPREIIYTPDNAINIESNVLKGRQPSSLHNVKTGIVKQENLQRIVDHYDNQPNKNDKKTAGSPYN